MKWPHALRKLLTVTTLAFGITPYANAQQGAGVGTLAYHLATNALGRVSRCDTNADPMAVLSGWGYAVYSKTNLELLTRSVWSTNSWLYGVRGLSATSIGQTDGMGGQGLITMVSPRHYLFSTHMHPEGASVAFLGTDNVIYWRKTLQRVDVTNDVSVGILNSDLPPAVGFLPVGPANLMSCLPTDNSAVIEGIGMNQDMRRFCLPTHFGVRDLVLWNTLMTVPNGLGTNWNVALRNGDSSNPVTLLIGNQLVLISHNTATNGGPNYAMEIPAINEKMRYLSKNNHVKGNYQLTLFSLDKWPKVQ